MIKALVIALCLSFSSSVLAYLDPGTGSIILQGLIAGIAVAWFTIKVYWSKVLSFFGKGQPPSLSEEEELSTGKNDQP